MIQWGDVPTWVAAVGTVGTLASALWQIQTERKRRIASDELLRSEQHVRQARLVAAYLGEEQRPESETQIAGHEGGRTEVFLVNNSSEPVYSVVVGIVFVQGAGPHSLEEMLKLNHEQYQRRGPVTTVSIVPGGLYRVWIAGTGWTRILSGRGGVEVAFSDAAGAHWIRRSTGKLDELAMRPLEHMQQAGLFGPHDFQTPERVPAA